MAQWHGMCHLSGMAVAESRVQEVIALLDVMKERGVTHLKIGDLELTVALAPPPPGEDEPKGKVLSSEEQSAEGRKERRRIHLNAVGGIISGSRNG